VIEMQAITALAHLHCAVLYFIDISEQCGYTIAQQVSISAHLGEVRIHHRTAGQYRDRPWRGAETPSHSRSSLDSLEKCGYTIAQQVSIEIDPEEVRRHQVRAAFEGGQLRTEPPLMDRRAGRGGTVGLHARQGELVGWRLGLLACRAEPALASCRCRCDVCRCRCSRASGRCSPTSSCCWWPTRWTWCAWPTSPPRTRTSSTGSYRPRVRSGEQGGGKHRRGESGPLVRVST
jgi:hypothetical protein